MEITDDQLATGEGLVTVEGILFQNYRYSCKAAIREGWYEQAARSGSWLVEVYYDPGCAVPAMIYIGGTDGREYTSDRLCMMLTEPSSLDDVAGYQDRLRKLMEERNGRKARK